MTTLLIILLVCGIAFLALYHRPKQDSVSELQGWFSTQLIEISDKLEKDIARDKQGHYPHSGRQSVEPRGSITYALLDKRLSRFELSQFSDLNAEHIKSTPGFARLKSVVDRLGLSLRLDEVELEGDGVETWHELDEFIYDIPRYYSITVSGWTV